MSFPFPFLVITLAVSVGVTDRFVLLRSLVDPKSGGLTILMLCLAPFRPEDAPQTGPWDKDLVIFGNPSFLEACSALSVLLFSFGGTPA